MLVKDLKAPDFLEILRHLEVQNQLYNIKRVSSVCSMVMRFAEATGQADYDPLPSLRGSFKRHQVKHLAAITDPKQVGRLLRSIDAYAGSFVVRCALKIAPYVFVRPSELRKARCEDIDFEVCEWRYFIRKTKTPHIVPLAPQVMVILSDLHKYTGHGEWVFSGQWQKGDHMCQNTVRSAMPGGRHTRGRNVPARL